MKRFLLTIALAAAFLPLQAQKPRAKDFNPVCDSLQQRLFRRTGDAAFWE